MAKQKHAVSFLEKHHLATEFIVIPSLLTHSTFGSGPYSVPGHAPYTSRSQKQSLAIISGNDKSAWSKRSKLDASVECFSLCFLALKKKMSHL